MIELFLGVLDVSVGIVLYMKEGSDVKLVHYFCLLCLVRSVETKICIALGPLPPLSVFCGAWRAHGVGLTCSE